MGLRGVALLPFVLVALLLATHPNADAQFQQRVRYERGQTNSDNAWALVPMKEHGLALVRDKEKYRNGLRLHEVILLDTALHETDSLELELPNRLNMVGYDYANASLYLLFREGETDDGDLSLVTITLATKAVHRTEIKHEFTLKLTHFWVVGPNIALGGYANREPAVLLYQPQAEQLKVVPGFFTSETELLDLRPNQNNTFNTLTVNRTQRAEKKLVLRTFDQDGVQLLEDQIDIDDDKTVLSGLTSSLLRDELMVTGTYTVGTSRQASGVFSVMVDPFRSQPVNYYDFAQLPHALDFMSAKRAFKITEKSRRDRLHGRNPDYRCYAASVRLDEYSEGFLLLTELYNLSSGMNSYPYQGNPYATPYGYYPFTPYASRFYNSPYSYYNQLQNSEVTVLQSLVVSFDAEGKVDWGHSLKLEGKRKAALEQASDFWATTDKIVIATKKESEILVKARFKNDEVQADTLAVLLKEPHEVVRNESKDDEGIRFWYDHFFYVWGYQAVKDPLIVNSERTRSVFYVVKLDVR
ncbi:MAG: hypothetical protein ACOYXA_06050 [Bacteroidota bacterium]